MAKHDAKGKIVSFKAAREAAFGDSPKAQEDRRQPEQQKTASPRTGGYAEVWLKANTDKDALIKENLSLREQKRKLEEEKQELAPSFEENVLYYTLIGLGFLYLIGWLTTSVYMGGAQ